ADRTSPVRSSVRAAPISRRASSSDESMPAARNRAASARRTVSMLWPGCEVKSSCRSTLSGKLGGLVLGGQRVDQFAQGFARDHLRKLVEGQVNAVVGDAPLREIIGA